MKPLAGNESNIKNKVSLQGANVSHMVFSLTLWLLGSSWSFPWLLLISSYSLSPVASICSTEKVWLYFLLLLAKKKKKKCDKNLRVFAEISSSVVFVPAVSVSIWCHILGMTWVLREGQMVSSVSCCTFFASHSWFNTFLHLPKQQSPLEFMFNKQFRFQWKMSGPHQMIICLSVYATSQMNTENFW